MKNNLTTLGLAAILILGCGLCTSVYSQNSGGQGNGMERPFNLPDGPNGSNGEQRTLIGKNHGAKTKEYTIKAENESILVIVSYGNNETEYITIEKGSTVDIDVPPGGKVVGVDAADGNSTNATGTITRN
ncbi:MAG: hypothetical protein H8E25_05650 [Planctomycetes bacterium]|nr:hypothetical protein [Planctomycetota bacterium]